MKTIALATALAAVAQVAHAQAVASPAPVDDVASHAADEAYALISAIKSGARVARVALERARLRHDSDELRCADEALSRADVALRAGREDAALLAAQAAAHDGPSALATLQRLRMRRAAAGEAAASAISCSARRSVGAADHTTVTVRADTSDANDKSKPR